MASHIVITTVQEPTPSVVKLIEMMGKDGTTCKCIVIGDKKGPAFYRGANTDFYPLDQQLELPFSLPGLLPTGHYSRKNIGYLLALREGAGSIYETDDDNRPLPTWEHRRKQAPVREIRNAGWVNIFQAYSNELIWPRGLPLSEVQPGMRNTIIFSPDTRMVDAPIQQGLVDGSPDVDSVWRLTMDREIHFHGTDSFLLPTGTWCPFNSQSTWWWPEAYPLLYLPSYCSFRMTDIWRGFVAQRCVWAMGHGLVFHPSEVYQQRNVHDLMRDFRDEVPGYLDNQQICALLEGLPLSGNPQDVGRNLHFCYGKLVSEGYVPKDEMVLLEAWLDDLAAVNVL